MLLDLIIPGLEGTDRTDLPADSAIPPEKF